jgi:hypothetical protein
MPIYRVTYLMPYFQEGWECKNGADYEVRLCYSPITEIVEMTEKVAELAEMRGIIIAEYTSRRSEQVSEDYNAVRMKMDWSINAKVQDEDEESVKHITSHEYPLLKIQKL